MKKTAGIFKKAAAVFLCAVTLLPIFTLFSSASEIQTVELTSIPSVFEPDINYTVKLSEDAVFESKMPEIPKKCSVTLDLNGHNILFKHEIENSLDVCTTNYKEHNNEYMGLITNNGSLDIVGEGEISAYIADYNYNLTENKDNLMAKGAAIINNGTLNIGAGVTVESDMTVAITDCKGSLSSAQYADLFVYSFGIRNTGTVNTSGTVKCGVLAMSYAGAQANSYHSAAAYGIFGGSVNIYGGKISADAGSGAGGSSSWCKESNRTTELAVGVFSNDLNISGNVQIDADVSAWMSANKYDCWSEGTVYQVSAGVMYEGKNYPKIDSGCSISAGYSRLDNAQIIIPGSDKYSTEKSYTVLSPDACKNQYRFAASVAGIHCLSQAAYAENDFEEVMDSGWFNSKKNDSSDIGRYSADTSDTENIAESYTYYSTVLKQKIFLDSDDNSHINSFSDQCGAEHTEVSMLSFGTDQSSVTDDEAPVLTSLYPSSYSVLTKKVNVLAYADDNIGVERYEASYSADNGETWTVIGSSVGKSGNICFDTSEVPDGVIQFRVLVYDKAGNIGGYDIIHTYKIDNTGPEKITGLSAAAVYSTQMTISWLRPIDADTDRFVLERINGDSVIVIDSNIKTLGYNLSDLIPGKEYSYRVYAVDMYGNAGEYSDVLTIAALPDTTAPVVTSQAQNSGAYSTGIVKYTAIVKDDYALNSVAIEYSYDRTNWTQCENYTYDDKRKNTEVNKEFDIGLTEEGSFYVRAVGTDVFGNIGDRSENAPFVEYYIDKTPPQQVSEVTAELSDRTAEVKWTASESTDVSSYSVYRSEDENGEFNLISSGIQRLNYIDASVLRNKSYYYKVTAVDNAGNESKFSSIVSVTVLSDTSAPLINSVSPENGTVGPVNSTIHITAQDNDSLKLLTVELKKNSSENYELFKELQLSKSVQTAAFDLPLDDFNDNDIVHLRIKVSDTAGIESEYTYVSYVIDKTAPSAKNIKITAQEECAVLTWSDCSEKDLSGFEIYRSIDGGVYSIVARRGVNGTGNYSFIDNITADSVNYRIDAVDRYGNRNSIYTETCSTKIILRAAACYDDKLTAQTALEFSASESISYYGIVSYKWSFSDNTSYEGKSIEKTFSDPGSYTVTLTITDAQGNTSEISKTITVTELVRYGTLKVRAVDETGSAIPGCGVYLDLGAKQQKEIKTSSDGCVSIQLCVGMHEIGVYKDGYLPDSRSISISCDTESEIVFKISKQEIVSGDFVVREMNFAEIVDAGIDVNDPANQQIYKVKVTLIYGNEKIPVEYIRTKTEIREYKIYDSDISSDTVHRNYTYNIKYIPNDDNKEIIAVVRMPVNASYLKQFFTATLTVFNNAGESYRLVDCKADIPIPDGLTLMKCTPISSLIPGGTSSCQTLVLRGDTAGTYSLNADFSATLEKFDKKVNASFVSNSFNVYDKNDVALVIEIPKSSVGEFRFNIGLENRRDSTVYYPQISINGMVEDITAQFKKLAAGDSNIEESDVKNLGFKDIGSFLRNADGSAVLYDSSEIPTEKIEPGCGIFIEYSTVRMPADGAEMYFSRAVADCEESFGGYVEIRFIEDNPLPVSEDEYIKEHIDFINGNEYPSASFDFASYMGEEIKKSSVYKELGLLSWGLGDIADDVFNKLNDEIAADYVNQIIEASTEDSKIQLKFMKKFSEITNYITNIVIADDSIHDKALFKNKIDSMLKGTDYDSSTNQMLHTLLGRYISSDVLDNIFAGYDTLGNISTIYHGADDLVDGIKQLTAYVSAIDAYRSVSDDIKQNLLDTAEKMQNSRLKNAVLSYANTAIDEEHYKSELRGMAIKNFVGNVFTFYKFSYSSVVKKAIKKLSVNVLKSILPGVDIASVSANFSVSLGLISATRALLSGLSQADKQREALKMIIRIADAAAASKSVMETEKSNLLTNESIESAKAFDTAYKSHKRWQLMAYAAFEDYGNAATDNIIAKTIGKNKREENLEALSDVIAQENRLKGIFCHIKGHELGCYDSKVIAVQCPVDVKLYDSNGILAAQIADNSSTVYDNLVSCFVFEESKLFAVPANLDYSVEITASGAGKMDYTVFEYKNGVETRKVCFDSQAISKDDIFNGSTGTALNADAGSYAIVKNSKELIAPTDDIAINVSGITIDKKEIIIDKDNTCKLNACVAPAGASDIKWKSSDDRIVSVNSDGLIKANKAGNAEIYAVSSNGGYIAAAEVTVLEHDFDSEEIKSASCTNEGSVKYTCKKCGFFDYEIIPPAGHCDNNNDGKCDICGFDMNSDAGNESNCPCGKYHSGLFAGLIKLIHKLIYFFKNTLKK